MTEFTREHARRVADMFDIRNLVHSERALLLEQAPMLLEAYEALVAYADGEEREDDD